MSAPDIRRIVQFFGASTFYGPRSIEVLPRTAFQRPLLRLGRSIVPGVVRVFSVPSPAWLLPGTLTAAWVERMRRYGADVEVATGDGGTTVRWPGDSLRDFVLIDVLMHEIGHHIVQQYTGKRAARVRRTRDHEAFAVRFAERCRLRYQQARPLR